MKDASESLQDEDIKLSKEEMLYDLDYTDDLVCLVESANNAQLALD